MDKKLLTKAAKGNTGALATLRRTTPANLTVFVLKDGTLDIDATLQAYQYYLDYQEQPDEWGEEPTVNFATAFPAKVRRDPVKLKPVTPGLWTDLWESENGHEMVAAIWYGIRRGHIHESELELKGRVRRHLESPDQLLLDVLREMKRDEGQMRVAMDVVNAPAEQIVVPAPRQQQTPRQQGQSSALADLEAEYNRGGIDVGRYLKLKASMTTAKSEWSHEKYIALCHLIENYFSMSEINGLVFDMGLDRDDFTQRRSVAARELTNWAKRRSQLDKLSGLVKDENPNRWMKFAAEWM